jgi:hypothetical protein
MRAERQDCCHNRSMVCGHGPGPGRSSRGMPTEHLVSPAAELEAQPPLVSFGGVALEQRRNKDVTAAAPGDAIRKTNRQTDNAIICSGQRVHLMAGQRASPAAPSRSRDPARRAAVSAVRPAHGRCNAPRMRSPWAGADEVFDAGAGRARRFLPPLTVDVWLKRPLPRGSSPPAARGGIEASPSTTQWHIAAAPSPSQWVLRSSKLGWEPAECLFEKPCETAGVAKAVNGGDFADRWRPVGTNERRTRRLQADLAQHRHGRHTAAAAKGELECTHAAARANRRLGHRDSLLRFFLEEFLDPLHIAQSDAACRHRGRLSRRRPVPPISSLALHYFSEHRYAARATRYGKRRDNQKTQLFACASV